MIPPICIYACCLIVSHKVFQSFLQEMFLADKNFCNIQQQYLRNWCLSLVNLHIHQLFLSFSCHFLVNYSFSLQFVSFTQQILSFNKKLSFFTQSFLVLFTTHSQQSYFTKITFHSNSTKISLSHISSKNFLFFFHSHKQNNPFQTKILIHCDIESVLLVFVLFQEWIPHHVVHTPDIVVDHEWSTLLRTQQSQQLHTFIKSGWSKGVGIPVAFPQLTIAASKDSITIFLSLYSYLMSFRIPWWCMLPIP